MTSTHSYIWPVQPQHGLSNIVIKPIENQQVCRRGIQLASREALMPRRVCIKNSLTCILKNHVSEFGAQLGSAINAFGTTHSDSERNSHPHCWLAILRTSITFIENFPSKWTLRRCKIEHMFCTANSCPKVVLKKNGITP